jgi:hypothetical protein
MNSGGLLANNTIVYNSTKKTENLLGEGGGVRIRGKPYPKLINNIIYWNESKKGLEDLDFQYPNDILDISYSNVGVGLNGVKVLKPSSNISANPRFRSKNDFRLLWNSPCIDAGKNIDKVVNDYSGTARPINGNNSGSAIHDMGAYEFNNR